MTMGTHKVYLTEEQWACACEDAGIRAEVEKQQPELFARICGTRQSTAADNSPVSDSNAADAINQIGKMRSRDRLQHIIDNDQRVTVQDAAKRRLAEI